MQTMPDELDDDELKPGPAEYLFAAHQAGLPLPDWSPEHALAKLDAHEAWLREQMKDAAHPELFADDLQSLRDLRTAYRLQLESRN